MNIKINIDYETFYFDKTKIECVKKITDGNFEIYGVSGNVYTISSMRRDKITAILNDLTGKEQEPPEQGEQEDIYEWRNRTGHDIDVRLLNALRALDVETIGQIKNLNPKAVLKVRGIGKGTMSKLEDLQEILNNEKPNNNEKD